MVTRRGILAGAAVGGGLIVAYALMPRTFPLPLEPREGEWAFGAWLKIGKDGIRLLPRNPDYAPIVVGAGQDFAIEGLYCGLVRPSR